MCYTPNHEDRCRSPRRRGARTASLVVRWGCPVTGPIETAQSGAQSNPALPAAAALVRSVAGGDRAAAAAFVLAYGPFLRRRLRGQLSRRLRVMVASDDMLSTVMRRLDRYMSGHSIRASSEAELLALITRISDAAVADKARTLRKLSRAESADLLTARERLLLRGSEEGPSPAETDSLLAGAFESLDSETERQILWLWLSGRSHAQIAEEVSMSHTAVRKRWERMRAKIGAAIKE